MALINCAECGMQISDKAAACPHCGAPPEVYVPEPWLPDETAWSSLDLARVAAATSDDGRELTYSEPVRVFQLGGVEIQSREVALLDKQGHLRWTRYDVRSVLHKSVRKGLPMGDLPVLGNPSFLERTSMFLDSSADSMIGLADALDPTNPTMVCPHCQSRGTVHTRKVNQKKGISGGKATAAVLTGGLSVLATGLSRKENMTEARCSKCRNVWHF